MANKADNGKKRIITPRRFKIIFIFLLYGAVFLSMLSINVLLYDLLWGSVLTIFVIAVYIILFEISTVEADWAFSVPEEVLKEFSMKEKILLIVRPLPFSVLLRIFLIGSLELVFLLCLTPILALSQVVKISTSIEKVLFVVGSLTAVSGILSAVFKYFERSSSRIGYVIDSIAMQIVMELSEILRFSKFSEFVKHRNDGCAKKVRPYIIDVETAMPKGLALLKKYLKERRIDPEKALRDLWRKNLLDKGFQGYIQLEEKIKIETSEKEREKLLNCLDKLYESFVNSRTIKEKIKKLKVELESMRAPLEKPVRKAILESLWIIPPLFYAEEPFVYYSLLEELSERKLVFYAHLKAILKEYFPSLFEFFKQC